MTEILEIAEKSVKELIKSYLIQFNSKDLLMTCEKLSISTKKIPKQYIKHADLYQLIDDGILSNKLMQNNSLFKIPEKNGGVKVKKDMFSYDTYVISLQIVPYNITWNEEIFQPFSDKNKENDKVADVKKHIGQILNMSHLTYAQLKRENEELLNNIMLVTDPENVSLKLIDNIIPKYNHYQRISFKIEKDTDN